MDRELRDLWAAGWAVPAALRALLPDAGAATPARALEVLLRTAARRLAGRRISVPGTELRLCVDALDVHPDPLGLPLGQLDDVRIAARDVQWRDVTCRRVEAVWRNVHLRPSVTPSVVSAPVEVRAAFSPADVAAVLARWRPGLAFELDDAAGAPQALLRRAAGPGWGAVAVGAEVGTDEVYLRPVGLRIADRRVPLPRWFPAARIALPPLPRGLRLREVVVEGEEIVVRLVADQWRQSLTPARLAAVAGWLDRFR